MPTIIKAATSADFLALVPELVGFVPKQSVVLVAFDGNRTHGAMRYDLPGPGSATVIKRFATHMVGMLCKLRDVQSVAIVVFSDDSFGDGVTPPEVELANALRKRIRQSGFGLRESLCQAADGWGSYLDDDTPIGGHPLQQIADSDITSKLPSGSRIMDVPTAERVPDADPASMRRVARSLQRFASARKSAFGPVTPIEFAAFEDITLFLENALYWSEAELERNDALLLFALQGPPMRDLAMMQWASTLETGDLIFDSTEAAAGNAALFDPKLADILLGIGPRPDVDRIDRGIALVTRLISLADDAHRPAPLCMLAWLNWTLGLSSFARPYLEEALRIDPGYGMAELLTTMMSNGMLPEWAFAG